MSAWHVGGTRGSGIVYSAADVLWMSLVRGMRGVGGVCEMCWARGGVVRGLGLGFTNPVGTGGVLDVCPDTHHIVTPGFVDSPRRSD